MKPETFSEAILCGYEMVGGQQCLTGYWSGGDPTSPKKVCVLGARNLCLTGDATGTGSEADNPFADPAYKEFVKQWGFGMEELNDEGMPWEHIYGMARAAGL